MKKFLVAAVLTLALSRPAYAQEELILAVLPFLPAEDIMPFLINTLFSLAADNSAIDGH